MMNGKTKETYQRVISLDSHLDAWSINFEGFDWNCLPKLIRNQQSLTLEYQIRPLELQKLPGNLKLLSLYSAFHHLWNRSRLQLPKLNFFERLEIYENK